MRGPSTSTYTMQFLWWYSWKCNCSELSYISPEYVGLISQLAEVLTMVTPIYKPNWATFFFGMQRFRQECWSNFCRESISPGFCWCAKPREATGVSEVRFSCEGSSRRLGDREIYLYMFYYIRQGVTHPKKIMWSWVYHLNSLELGSTFIGFTYW
jgi:hypothetical protein